MLKQKLGRIATVLVGLMLVAGPVVGQPPGPELTTLAQQGEALFHQRCAACHSLGGGDRPTGPDLAGVTERRDRQWLVDFIADPAAVIAGGDPIAAELLTRFNNLKMPNLQLDPGQVDALLAFLALSSATTPGSQAEAAPPEAEAAPPVNGDAGRGERLFTGEIPLVNGGAPCLACHGIVGVGLAGGANFGPDLTLLQENFGTEGVGEVLESLAFPTMAPIYAARPLTEDERLDLGAFFARVNGSQMRDDRSLPAEVAGGVLALLAALLLLGWGRLISVRRSLVARATQQKGELR